MTRFWQIVSRQATQPQEHDDILKPFYKTLNYNLSGRPLAVMGPVQDDVPGVVCVKTQVRARYINLLK